MDETNILAGPSRKRCDTEFSDESKRKRKRSRSADLEREELKTTFKPDPDAVESSNVVDLSKVKQENSGDLNLVIKVEPDTASLSSSGNEAVDDKKALQNLIKIEKKEVGCDNDTAGGEDCNGTRTLYDGSDISTVTPGSGSIPSTTSGHQTQVVGNSNPVEIVGRNHSHSSSNALNETTLETQAPVCNFFEFTSKPLPKVEPLSEPASTNTPTLAQVAHYNQHTKDEELEYVGSGPTIPIPIRDGEASDEEVDFNQEFSLEQRSTSTGRSRYFRKESVFQQYDFCRFNFPTIKNLAVYQYRDQLIEAVKKNTVVVVEGFTGCGKTTQVPQFILDDCFLNNVSCNIVVTQPRRIATQSVAERVCKERGWQLGTVVGYQVGMETKTSRRETLLTYMTTGVLLQKVIHSNSLRAFSHIIIDEVHERDLDCDFLLLVLKKILLEDEKGKNKHIKIILMSATLNADKFSHYFSFQKGREGIQPAPIVKIPMSSAKFPVEEIFLDDLMGKEELRETELDFDKPMLSANLYELAVKTIVDLDYIERGDLAHSSMDPRLKLGNYKTLRAETRGSVLVFLPGFYEITTLMKKLNEEAKKQAARNFDNPIPNPLHEWNIIPLHSSITGEEQYRVFLPSTKGARKIILSTNIAESSVTVPDVVYVIDFCLTKCLSIDPKTNFSCLRINWASLSQCIQRRGRTGRVAPGRVYRFVPNEFYRTLERDTIPVIQRAGLEGVVVKVKSFRLGNPKDVLSLAIDAPPLSGIERSVVNLKELGGLTVYVQRADGEPFYDTCDGDLTFTGKVMSELPIPHQCARLIMLGHAFSVLKESIIIAAALSCRNPFTTSADASKKLDSYLSKLKWAQGSYSDCLALLHVYKAWNSAFPDDGGQAEYRWTRSSHVRLATLREIRSVAEDIEKRLEKLQVVPSPFQFAETSSSDSLPKEKSILLKVAIAGAFYPNYFHRPRPLKDYYRSKLREVNGNDLLNTIYFKGFPTTNDGTIYAKKVANDLAVGLNVPQVTFSGQKVFASFDGMCGEKIGPVSKMFYRAIKRRLLRIHTSFPTLWKSQELSYRHQQDDLLRTLKDSCANCPKQVGLPPISVDMVYGSISYVATPGQFWIIYNTNKTALDVMDEFINATMIHVKFDPSKLVHGTICLAQHAGRFYRVRIRAVELTEILVFYIDYGNSAWVKVHELRPFSEAQLQKSYNRNLGLAVECRLARMAPAVVYGSIWHDTSIKRLRDLEGITLSLRVYGVEKGVIVVLAYKPGPDGGMVCVNEELIKEGFADLVEENSACEQNHQARERKRNNLIHDYESEAHNKAQQKDIVDFFYYPPPHKDDCLGAVVTLKGPFSPLEMEFTALCNASNLKIAHVDDMSVNCIALDHEPAAPTSRLIIAAAVTIQDRNENVVARDTTMMPSIPGILPLMAMLFATEIELRVDRHHSTYTGVLCGLGRDIDFGNAVYQDHDIEIVFDTEITNDDINAINTIRFYLNQIFREDQSTFLGPIHTKLVGEILRLLKQQRKRLDNEIWPQKMFEWGKIPPGDIVPPTNTFRMEPLDMFRPHSTVNLVQSTFGEDMSWGDFAI